MNLRQKLRRIVWGSCLILFPVSVAWSQPVCFDTGLARSTSYFTGETGQALYVRPAAIEWVDARYRLNEDHGFMLEKPILENAVVNDYISSIMQRLLTAWPGVTPEVSVYIAIDPLFDARYFHGSGEILITTGLLDNIASEDELAGILAHELAHAMLQHEDGKKLFGANRALVSNAATIATLASIAKNAEVTKTDDSLDLKIDDEEVQEDLEGIVIRRLLLDTLNDDVWEKSWNRGSERDADQMALDLLVCAGYSLRGLHQYLEKDLAFKRKFRGEFDRHMALSSEQIEASLQRLDFNAAYNQILETGVQTAFAGLGAIGSRVIADYQSPEKRKEVLKEYEQARYTRRELNHLLNTSSAREILQEGDGARVIASHKAAYSAFIYLSDGQVRQAEDVLSTLDLNYGSDVTYPRYVQFLVARKKFGLQSASAYLYEIPNIEQLPLSAYQDVINSYIELGDVETVDRLIARGKNHYLDEDRFLFQELSLARMNNDQEMLQTKAKACLDNSAASMAAVCSTMAGIELEPKESKTESPLDSVGSLFKSLRSKNSQ